MEGDLCDECDESDGGFGSIKVRDDVSDDDADDERDDNDGVGEAGISLGLLSVGCLRRGPERWEREIEEFVKVI